MNKISSLGSCDLQMQPIVFEVEFSCKIKNINLNDKANFGWTLFMNVALKVKKLLPKIGFDTFLPTVHWMFMLEKVIQQSLLANRKVQTEWLENQFNFSMCVF